MNEFDKAIYRPSPDERPLSRDSLSNDLIQQLAKRLFSLPDAFESTQIPCDIDPRGYVDLYGKDTETEYLLTSANGEIRFKSLACFFDHISFLIPDGLSCAVLPETSGLHIYIFTSADELVIDSVVSKVSDFACFIAKYAKTGRERRPLNEL